MNLINMRTGARVTSSSSKHSEIFERYKAEDSGYREATQLEYELMGLLMIHGPLDVKAALAGLIREMEGVKKR